MMIERLGADRMEISPRHEGRQRGSRDGERFNVGQKNEEPGSAESSTGRSEHAGSGRRRPTVRYAKRAGEVHGAREHGQREEDADALKVDEAAFHLDFDENEGEPGLGKDGEAEGDQGGQAGDADDRATTSDFEALATHLLNLQGPIREVTLYLPALGRVTARTEAGAINIIVDVPRRLLAAVRRGQREMTERMIRQGLNVARIVIETHDDDDDPQEAPARPRGWPACGLVDVMA